MTRRISLSVNDVAIETDYFVQGFIDHTVYGMVSSLEGVGDVSEIRIVIKGIDANIWINGDLVPVNDFVSAMVSSTVRGMVLPLKGVEDTEKIQVAIER